MRCLYSRSHFTPVENLGRLLSDSDFDTDAMENVTVPNVDFVTRIYRLSPICWYGYNLFTRRENFCNIQLFEQESPFDLNACWLIFKRVKDPIL